jgi:hypothetical protein
MGIFYSDRTSAFREAYHEALPQVFNRALLEQASRMANPDSSDATAVAV